MEVVKQALIGRLASVKNHLMSEFVTVRSGRANAGLLDKILVNVYDQTMPVANLATVTIPDPRQLLVQPWDRTNTTAIEKAILEANLGFGIVNEGERIRLTLPLLSNERREELVKLINRLAEETKISIRNARREAFDALDAEAKKGGISDDDKDRFKKDWQELVDGAVRDIDQMSDKKSAELRSF